MSSECREDQVPGVMEHAGADAQAEVAGDLPATEPQTGAEATFRNEATRWRRGWIEQALHGAQCWLRGERVGPAEPVPARKPHLYLVRNERSRRTG